MPSLYVQFIGGPLDGTWRWLDDPSPVFFTYATPKQPIHTRPAPTCQLQIHQYNLEWWKDGDTYFPRYKYQGAD